MTPEWARQRARELAQPYFASELQSKWFNEGIDAIASALTAAKLDGWREGRRRAASVMDDLGDKDKNDNLVNDQWRWCEGYETGCREGAVAIRSLPDPPLAAVELETTEDRAALTNTPTPSPAGGSEEVARLIAEARKVAIGLRADRVSLQPRKDEVTIDALCDALEALSSPSPPLAAAELETTEELRENLRDLLTRDLASISRMTALERPQALMLLRDIDRLLSALRTRDDVIEECAVKVGSWPCSPYVPDGLDDNTAHETMLAIQRGFVNAAKGIRSLKAKLGEPHE